MQEMRIKEETVNYIDVNACPEKGFNFPFRIIIPKNLSDSPELIYACNLPQDYTKDCDNMDELIERTRNEIHTDPTQRHLSLTNGNPMMIPFVPRLKTFRPNFLGRDCLNNKFELKDSDKRFEDSIHMYDNLADQHKAMIEYAIESLRNEGINVDDKAVIVGYSEGAKFASHLALLHPEVIKTVVAGGTGGVISMPVDEVDGYEFVYPTGIAGLKNFNYDSFKDITFFYYMGDTDKSDSAMPNFDDYHYINDEGEDCILRDECGNNTPYIDSNGNQVFKLDENGNYTAKFSLLSDSEVNAINKALGTVTQKRFMKQKSIYESLGLNAFFKLYPGNHRTVFDNREDIFDDLDGFIKQNVKEKNK